MQIVIPSRNRLNVLKAGALKLFPDALVCVGESEAKAYRTVSDNLLIHPDNIVGIGPLRQWILDNVKDEIVVQVDDDTHTVYSLCGYTKRTIHDRSAVERIVATTALCAQEAGCKVFGFNQAWDVRKVRPFKPFGLNSWAGGVVGFIGRDRRYDCSLKLRADIDFFLTSLLKDRIVWIENRYAFVHKRWEGAGGNAMQRSQEQHERETQFLLKKWGMHLSAQKTKSTVRLVTHVER